MNTEDGPFPFDENSPKPIRLPDHLIAKLLEDLPVGETGWLYVSAIQVAQDDHTIWVRTSTTYEKKPNPEKLRTLLVKRLSSKSVGISIKACREHRWLVGDWTSSQIKARKDYLPVVEIVGME